MRVVRCSSCGKGRPYKGKCAECEARCDVSICTLDRGHDGAHVWPDWFQRREHLPLSLRVVK